MDDRRMRLTVAVLVVVSTAWAIGLVVAVAALGVVLGIASLWGVSLLALLAILRHDLSPARRPARRTPRPRRPARVRRLTVGGRRSSASLDLRLIRR